MKGLENVRLRWSLAGPSSLAAVLVSVLIVMALPNAARAADPGSPAPPAAAKKADPPILIGPSRVTLVGGKTLEAIAVFREPDRVRVVLEDDTEIDFDPAKVVSVIALADLPDEPAPKAKPAMAKGKAKGAPGAAPRTPAGGPVRVHAEPGVSGRTASSSKGSTGAVSATNPGSPTAEDSEDSEEAAAGGEVDARKEQRDRDVEELAAMLQHAIANAALEGPGAGGPDDPSADTDEAAAKSGKDATTTPDGDTAGGGTPADDEKKLYRPRPQDLDATRPVNKAGFRFLGVKGKYPETPPQTDFPQPSAPATSLGFENDTWRPSSGFSSNVKWGTPLPPATSFSNRLTGLEAPITSFGPSWWGPTPTSWPSSIFPQNWRPKDGFAESMERKTEPSAPGSSTSSETSDSGK